MDEPAELYTQLWDEPPPPRLDNSDDDEELDPGQEPDEAEALYEPAAVEPDEPEADADPEPERGQGRPVLRISYPHRVEDQPADNIELRASEVIQQMTVDTLRRVESRLADLDRKSAYGTGDIRATVEAVELLCSRLRRAALELNGYLDQTRKMIHELSQIQLESRRNLTFITQRLRELEKPD